MRLPARRGCVLPPTVLFFIVEFELGTRRVVHMGVTREPTQAWAAQQWREATPYGVKPRFVLRDNDSTYGSAFDGVAKATGIEVLRTPYRVPRVNAIAERFVGSLRREWLDHHHLLIFSERQLNRVIAATPRDWPACAVGTTDSG